MRHSRIVKLRRMRMGRTKSGHVLKGWDGKVQVLEVSMTGLDDEGLQRVDMILGVSCRKN